MKLYAIALLITIGNYINLFDLGKTKIKITSQNIVHHYFQTYN